MFSQAQCADQAHQNRIRDAEMKNNLNQQVGGEKIEVKMADCGGSDSCEQNAKLTASTTDRDKRILNTTIVLV